MADFTLKKTVSGNNKDNAASRTISSFFKYDAAQHKRITGFSRKDGIWCSCGGQSQSVKLSGYDRLIDTSTNTTIKKSNTGTCTCHGTGPASENYMTCSFTNWTEAESKAAIAAWAAGKLKITRTVSITSYTSSDHGSPTFRDGYYNDVITITGNDVPYTNYGPKIVSFSVKRSSNGLDDLPTSTKVYAKIRLSMTDVSGLTNSPSLTVQYSNDPNFVNPQSVVLANTQSTITPYLNADTTVLIGSSFGIGSNYYFRLVFTAGEESSAPMMASVGMSNVPVHIPDNNCGFSAGGYSNATPGDERFESHWQGFFYAGIYGVTNYSEDEINTGGKWIDGKPIYRKTVDVGATTAGTNKTVDLGFTIDTLVRAYGMGINSNNSIYPLPYHSHTAANSVGYYLPRGDKLMITPGSGAQAYVRCYMTIEYTKTQAVSAPLRIIAPQTSYDPALDDGNQIPDEQALNIITGGET